MTDMHKDDRIQDRRLPSPAKPILIALVAVALFAIVAWGLYVTLSGEDGITDPTRDPSPPVQTPVPE